MFWPSLAREVVKSSSGILHWARCIEASTDFVGPNSIEPRATTLPVRVFVKDLYLRARKDLVGPTVTLELLNHQSAQGEEVEKDGDQLSSSQSRALYWARP